MPGQMYSASDVTCTGPCLAAGQYENLEVAALLVRYGGRNRFRVQIRQLR